jgi:glycosyltransferase involved in cell wall biosynthesis
VELSIVVPCFNEEAVIDSLLADLAEQREHVPSNYTDFEVVLVDDGSTDGTLARIEEAARLDPRIRFISLSRNFGKEAAMLAGMSQARGKAVAMMDADLQHPPALLAKMLPVLEAGYDQVVARRTRTGDGRVRSHLARWFYRAMNAMTEVQLQDGVGDFRLLSDAAVRAILSLDEHNRFSKGLYAWIGFRTATIDYENVRRAGGTSKWKLRKLFSYGFDAMVSFNFRPLRLALYFGALVTAVALGYAFWVLGDAVLHGNPVPGYVTLICTVVGLGGVQLMVLGVIGEYLGRIYMETKRRPHFLIRRSSDGPAHPSVAVRLGPGEERPGTILDEG